MKANYVWLLLVALMVNFTSCQNEISKISSGVVENCAPASRSLSDSIILICGTPSSTPPSWIFSTTARSVQSLTQKNIDLHVHVIRDSKGNGLNKEIVMNTVLSNLNLYFQDTNIQFIAYQSSYIDSDFYSFDTKAYLYNDYVNPNAINVFVLSKGDTMELPNGTMLGQAQGIPSNSCIIHPDYYNTYTVAHEVGHCLGLYHTHHGTYTETGTNDNQQPELVNGFQSDVTGDYISDTPADPYEWDYPLGNCTYQITKTDANGDVYNPDPHNLMCYAQGCQEYFTDGQISRMHDFIANESVLRKTIRKDDVTIVGPTHFCSSGTYSILSDLSSVESIEWHIQTTTFNPTTENYDFTQEIRYGQTLTLENYEYLNPKKYNVYANVSYTDESHASSNSISAISNETSPYFGRIYWSCGVFSNVYTEQSGSTGCIEIYNNQTLTFQVHQYLDHLGYSITNPNVEAFALDLYTTAVGNSVTIEATSDFMLGEGVLEIGVANSCATEGVHFLVPCIIFDANSYSMSLNNDNLTIAPTMQYTRSIDTAIDEVSIMNANMEILLAKSRDSSNNIVSIDTSTLPQGNYYVRILSGEKKYFKKLAIN